MPNDGGYCKPNLRQHLHKRSGAFGHKLNTAGFFAGVRIDY